MPTGTVNMKQMSKGPLGSEESRRAGEHRARVASLLHLVPVRPVTCTSPTTRISALALGPVSKSVPSN